MATDKDRIAQLAPEIQAQIRSSVQISSLSDVILGLVKNSLDAKARHITIHLDFWKGYCSVLDDGHGILKDEFLQEQVGQLYFTSKHIDSQTSYGRYGRFLSSLSGVSLLSVTSSHILEDTISSIVLKDGKLVVVSNDISDEELDATSHGTRVAVHNLFGQMPVRVKRRHLLLESQKECDKAFAILKRSLVDLILAAPQPCHFEVRDAHHCYIHRLHTWSRQNISNTMPPVDQIVSTLFQAGFLESADTKTWQQVSVRVLDVSLSAAINLRPAPSKTTQFMSVNQYPLPLGISSTLFDCVNALFDTSTFGVVTKLSSNTKDSVETPKVRKVQERVVGRKEVDKWPMFYIRIHTQSNISSVFDSAELVSNRLFNSIQSALHILVTEFLRSHGFGNCKPETAKKANGYSRPHGSSIDHPVTCFENLTRIKSGTGVPTDILSGLPFISSGHLNLQQAQSPILTQDLCAEGRFKETVVKWFNPQTNNVLHVDARTGMAISMNQSDQPPQSNTSVPWPVYHSKTIDDVTSTLKGYFPFPQVDEALKSVATDYDSPKSLHNVKNNEHVCILNSGSPMHISGLTKMEPIGLNITKDDLKTAKILGQVDKKFILASIVTEEHYTKMVLIDQHAADERIKVEELYQALCSDVPVSLLTAIVFEVNKQDMERFKRSQNHFATCGIHYSTGNNQIRISALPRVIAEKCRLEPKLLTDFLRAEIWKEIFPFKSGSKNSDWLMQIGAFPQGVLDILMSRACRSAIMFNDSLTLKECEDLVQRLYECAFPFQCAHGRPSMTIIAKIQDIDIVKEEEKASTFGQRWKAWD